MKMALAVIFGAILMICNMLRLMAGRRGILDYEDHSNIRDVILSVALLLNGVLIGCIIMIEVGG